MASSAPSAATGKEEAGNQGYFKRHYFEKIFKEGWSFSGFERDKVFLNKRDGSFLDVSGVSGADSPTDARGVAFADYDNDGDMDIFVHTIQGTRHLLFRNDVGTKGNFVRVELEGTKSNRDAYGAKLTVNFRRGNEVFQRVFERRSARSYASACDPRVRVGLGREPVQLEKVEIRWPSGTRQVLAAPTIDKLHIVTESR